MSDVRDQWVTQLHRVAGPVLRAAAGRALTATMPVEQKAGDRTRVSPMEAVARTLTGISPWLEADALSDAERKLQSQLRQQAVAAIASLVDPASPDHAPFDLPGQPLVEAAFLSHALLRAPKQLFEALPTRTKLELQTALEQSRVTVAGMSNWLLFAAIVEVAIETFFHAGQHAAARLAVQQHLQWYKGDGHYGDGAAFHADFYNSYVIHPMLLDVAEHSPEAWQLRKLVPTLLPRAQRYAAVQERLIARDGTFPVLGRSIAYRGGAFQLLAMMALRQQLPPDLAPAAVRGALTAMMRQTLEPAGTFDDAGWLRIGLAGHQPSLGEPYISTGSLYLCSALFLPLGLPASDPFWADPDTPWTAQRAWSGQDLPADHALHD